MPDKFEIRNDRLEADEWGTIDKPAQWRILKAGIANQTPNVAEALQEMYAVVKAEINEELTQADVWGPHHTIRQNGVLVLNRSGMVVAASALLGARAEPDLSPEQMARAARHLLRHYNQANVNLQAPPGLVELAGIGEMIELPPMIVGEMRPTDIPLAPGVSILALKAQDDDPMEVVMEIPSGVSQRGWIYGKTVIRQLAEQISQKMYAGYLGHQKSENLSNEFPQPVTHWVGATYRDGKALVRGVVDKAASDLKRWIRAGAITQVSLYGYVGTEVKEGVTHVTSIDLLSLDWVPLDRAGMKTRLLAVGESNLGGKKDMAESVVVTVQGLLAEMRKLGVKPSQVVGEMGWDVKALAKDLGWKLDDVAGEIGAERWGQLVEAVKVVGEIADLHGLGKESKLADLLAAVKTAREAQKKVTIAEHTKLVDKVVSEMVQAEVARPLVKRMLQVDAAADEAAIKKVVGELLENKDIKDALAGVFKEFPLAPKKDDRGSSTNFTTKRSMI